MLLSSTGHLKCICRSYFRYLLYAIIIYRSSKMYLPIIFPLSPLFYYHLQVISNASSDHISVISFMLLSSTGHLKCICPSYFRYFLYAIIIYRSSQMHLPIMFPLFSENRKSIPKFLSGKCNLPDFKSYLSELSKLNNKTFSHLV